MPKRLRYKYILLFFGVQLVCLVVVARFMGLSVSIQFASTHTGTRDLHMRHDVPAQQPCSCTAQESIPNKETIPIKESIPNKESIPDNKGIPNKELIPDKESIPNKESILNNNSSVPQLDASIDTRDAPLSAEAHFSKNKHYVFQKSEYTCSTIIEGNIPEKAKRHGYVVKDYPHANIDQSTGFYELSPRDKYNSNIAVEEIDEELLAKIKEYIPHIWSTYWPFSPDYRNPCRVEPGKAHCMPYFHILTGAKSGSTDFWYSLQQHPMLFTTHKEPHWWTRDKKHSIKLYEKSFGHFQECIEEGKDPNNHNYVTGDSSTSSLWDNHLTIEWSEEKGLGKYPTVLLADIIRALTPNARIIFLLRNPIERLYSDYYYIYGGRSAQSFDALVKKYLNIFNDCLKREDERTCAYRLNRGNAGNSIFVGLYIIYVRDWLRRFPLEQVLFLRSDDWFKGQKPDMLLKTYHFLDIDVTKDEMRDILTIDTLKITIGKENVLRSSGRKKKNPMLPSTRQLLEEFYEPSNRALVDLTGNDGFLWKD